MSRLLSLSLCLGLTGAFLQCAAVGGQEVPVYRKVAGEKLESILKKMSLEYKKTADTKKAGVFYYTYIKGGNVYRLHNYQGQDLWIDVVFSDPMTLDDVNKWNIRAKFSRAVLVKQNDKSTVSLESQLDCLGGVHDAMITQFVVRFESEVKEFEKTLAK